jgi:hypothetical protein
MRATYRFDDWVREELGDCADEDVRVFFAERGLEMVEEQWRKLRRGLFSELRIETWCRICDITGKPLSYFIDYIPAGPPPRPRPLAPHKRRRPKRAAPPAKAAAVSLPPPPDPFAFLHGDTA